VDGLLQRRPRPRLGQVDVVHAPSLAVPPPGKLPLVVTVHDLAFVSHPQYFPARGVAFHRRGLELARREAAVIVAPSRFTAAELESAGFPAEQIHVVPHGIDPPDEPPADTVAERLRAVGLADGEPYALAVGTVEPRKGHDVLLPAFSESRRTQPKLRLVVTGPAGWGKRPALEQPGVIAPGWVSDETLDALYRGAVVLVVASRTEGFGLPVIEAMARGCPVIGSAAGALPEVMGRAGILVPEGDPEALAGAIGAVLGDPTHRQELAELGLRRAAQFTWAACLEGHRRAYQAAVTGEGPS
jgi:glycosyltransferase involved in cell wall biosynthesis